MYQFIVLGLGLLLVVGGGFLIKTTDSHSEGILSKAFSNTNEMITVPPTVETVTGEYSCDGTSGCVNPKVVTLDAYGGAHMVTTHIEGEETLKEEGTWRLEQGGLITLILSDSASEHYEIPHVMLIQSVNVSGLSKISYDTRIYTDMHKPIFKRDTEVEQ